MPPKPPLRVVSSNLRRMLQPSFSKPAPTAKPRLSPQPSASAPAIKTPPSPPPPPKPSLLRYANIALLSLCTVLLTRDHLLSIDHVNGSSMSPTLSPSAHETGARDRILVQRNVGGGNRMQAGIKRGDVITFWKPHKPHEISIKRVVALEGDVVYPHRGYALERSVVQAERVALGWDGLEERDEDAVDGEEVEVGKVVVPKAHVWVEGDNWRKSFDSLEFGPVNLGLVDGQAVGFWRGGLNWGWVGDERKREKGHVTRVVRSDEVRHAEHAG